MVIFTSGYIFLAKVDKLPGDINDVKTYINDTLFLIKGGGVSNHINYLKVLFSILRAAGLKVNVPKCSLGLKGVP